MLFHIAKEENAWPPLEFLKGWGKEISPIFQTGLYHQLAEATELPVGTYLFSDLEMASPLQREVLGQIWTQLEAHRGSRLLNNPLKVKGRYELLKALYEDGTNDFRAFHLDEVPSDLRFPVFVRIEADHQGSRTPLLENWRELDRWIVKAALGGANPDQLLVTEFSDTRGQDRLYRKYGAFKVGERVIARLIHFGNGWMVKSPDLIFEEGVEEERRYMENNPYEAELRRIFELAAVDYGRMDFAVRDGKVVVWEINTNPIITHPPEKYKPAHIPAQQRFAAQMVEALKAINLPASGARVPIALTLGGLVEKGWAATTRS
ncbi:MAG TPA: hypothetical protein VHE55_00680 [Fimbriimonadaceae bacterium]|nr:hypothetical protein [Fimbriimonadaceae bacterium]